MHGTKKPRARTPRLGKKLRLEIEATLRSNQEFRARAWFYHQDFVARGHGEVFYKNMTLAEFDALPFQCKRNGGPAYICRTLHEPYSEVYKGTKYEGMIAVYLHTYELDKLKIRHSF